MKSIYKFIPNFSRYVINKNGEIKNHLTSKVQKPDATRGGKCLLVNDEGKNERVQPNDLIQTLFAKPVKPKKVKDPFLADTSKIIKELVLPEPVRTRIPKKHDFDKMTAEEKAKVHASNKLTNADVIRIRYLLDNKIKSKKEIGVEYGMTQQNAGRIGNRKIYTQIPEQNAQG